MSDKTVPDNTFIYSLLDSYINEAKKAPKLFRDLAKVEQYIAESYKSRSFIEIIQNADDAGASEILVTEYEDGLLIANNGKPFSVDDVEAICRSGSSQKIRGKTIGYRGIGFKSTANLAKSISIISGDFHFNFNKEKTIKKLAEIGIDDVPLIRIPHIISNDDYFNIKKKISPYLNNFSTFFLFTGIDNRVVTEEFADFDSSSLLFLRNIVELTISLGNTKRKIIIDKKKENSFFSYKIQENDESKQWLVINSEPTKIDTIAFKLMNDTILPASISESVIHAFTPTNEFSGAFFKINGDFSTDPSRKTIDCDEMSNSSYTNAIDLLGSTLIKCLEGDIQIKGIFSPFVNIKGVENSKFKRYFKKRLNKLFNERKIQYNNQIIQISNFRLKPEWLNIDDYNQVCHSGIVPLSQKTMVDYPEITQLFKDFDVQVLSLNDLIERLNISDLKNTGLAQIFARIIKQYSFDWSEDKISSVQSLQLFPVDTQRKRITELSDYNDIDSDFRDFVLKLVDKKDLDQFLFKFNKSGLTTPPPHDGTSKPPRRAIIKWKRAEKNVEEFLKLFPTIISVNDVSRVNIGYDLEVIFSNSDKIYVEVKSLKNFNEPFGITNNEYAEAHRRGDRYYLALIVMEPEILIKFIQNPLNILQFDRICERWSWRCEDYKDYLTDKI